MGKTTNINPGIGQSEQERLNKMIEALTVFMTMQQMARITDAHILLDTGKDKEEIKRLSDLNGKAKSYVNEKLAMNLSPDQSLVLSVTALNINSYLHRSGLTDIIPKIKKRHFKVDKESKAEKQINQQFAETSANLAKVMIGAIRNTPWKNREIAAIAMTVAAFATVIITGFVTPSFYTGIYSGMMDISPAPFSIALAMMAVASMLIFASSFAVLSHQNRKNARLKEVDFKINEISANVDEAYPLKVGTHKKEEVVVNIVKETVNSKAEIIFDDEDDTPVLTSDVNKNVTVNLTVNSTVSNATVECNPTATVDALVSTSTVANPETSSTVVKSETMPMSMPVVQAPTTSTTTVVPVAQVQTDTNVTAETLSPTEGRLAQLKNTAALKYSQTKTTLIDKVNSVTKSRATAASTTTNTVATSSIITVEPPVTTATAIATTTTTASASSSRSFIPTFKIPPFSNPFNRHQQIKDDGVEMNESHNLNNTNASTSTIQSVTVTSDTNSVVNTPSSATNVINDNDINTLKKSTSASSGLNLLGTDEKGMTDVNLNDDASSQKSDNDLNQGAPHTQNTLQLSGKLVKAKSAFKNLLSRNASTNPSSSSNTNNADTNKLLG